MASLLADALAYAENGYAVIPVGRNKIPLINDWPNQAATDTRQIISWWSLWPDANIGIVCGEKSGGLIVADVDIKNGKHGDEALQQFQAMNGDFPSTVMCRTGSGGLHYYFKDPEHFAGKYKNDVEVIPGVDIRTDGGFVVVPPSVNAEGHAYTWVHDVGLLDEEPADLNESAAQLLTRSHVKKKQKTDRKTVVNVPKGSRNNTLFRYCCTQVGAGVPQEIAEKSALDLNDTFDPPLSDSEVHTIVESAYSRYQPNERTIYGAQEEPVTESDLDMPTMEDYPEEPVEWLIPEYLPKGQITLICGTGGTGKTSVWISLLASISSGDRILFDGFGDYYDDRQPMQCMFFSSEDTVENVIKGKLRKGHARMRNIHTISLNDPRFEKIQFGSKYLEKLLDKYRPALCVFDPLQAFIDGHIKMADRNAMRQTMRSLIEWGKTYGTTFLIVMHTNKQLNVWGRNRMADSADLWDIARCVWMVGDADDQGMKYLSHEKSNYGRTGKTMLFRNDDGQPVFKGWTDKKDREFVMEAAKKRNEAKSGNTLSDVCGAILSELADHPDGMLIADLDEVLQQIGYSAWAIKRAKAELKDGNKIRMYKVAMDGGWMVKKV